MRRRIERGSIDRVMQRRQVLGCALNLEYLEAEFYTYALFGASITSFGIGINGQANGSNPTTGGTTVGGNKVTFSNNLIFSHDIAAEIGSDRTSEPTSSCFVLRLVQRRSQNPISI